VCSSDLEANNPDKAAEVRVIWKSPMIPLDPIVRRADLPDDLKKKLDVFFLTYGVGDSDEAERQRQVLAKMSSGWKPFRKSSNAQLLPMREIMLAGKRMKIDDDETMDANEKTTKLDELDKQLQALEKEREAAATKPK